MSIIITAAETAVWLKERDGFLILTHRRPDGDTSGCAGALAQALREIGKTAYILNNPEITPRYLRFIEDYIAPDGYSPRYIISVDTASTELFPVNGKEYGSSISLCIDHHPSNTYYAEYTCLDESSAACGEILYNILIAMSGKVSAISAGHLYAAVSTDTGCFAFGNTTADTLRVAAELIDAGAPNKELNKLLFRTKTRSRIKIEAMINAGLEYYYDGVVDISTITRDMVEAAEADEDDLDDIAAIPGSVYGVGIGITIRELGSKDECKGSVRTTTIYNAYEIAKHFGGGGHRMAAGFSVSQPVSEIKKELLKVLEGVFS